MKFVTNSRTRIRDWRSRSSSSSSSSSSSWKQKVAKKIFWSSPASPATQDGWLMQGESGKKWPSHFPGLQSLIIFYCLGTKKNTQSHPIISFCLNKWRTEVPIACLFQYPRTRKWRQYWWQPHHISFIAANRKVSIIQGYIKSFLERFG